MIFDASRDFAAPVTEGSAGSCGVLERRGLATIDLDQRTAFHLAVTVVLMIQQSGSQAVDFLTHTLSPFPRSVELPTRRRGQGIFERTLTRTRLETSTWSELSNKAAGVMDEMPKIILEPTGTEVQTAAGGARRYRKSLKSFRWCEIRWILGESFQEWNKHKAPRLGAALAFYTLLSITPLLLVVVP